MKLRSVLLCLFPILSVETYPRSYNSCDSLTEAYMDHGKRDLAIKN